ncbi:IS630 transposase-related protein [Psychrobacter sp. I-STPA6b]|uniref:IS630 transposase-related protein n=1 Tax=Psychrobacter sp. I-STPA6b TaxID=2585718 RepID=UPI001D0C40ED|nr:IS630 transposase-related protein [Psychrobacter sp. I-STPA6b]
MTYSLDFRKQVLKSLEDGMTFTQASEFYNLSPTTIQKWKKRLKPKTSRNTKPYKISDEALLQDIADYPDDYQYERAIRLGCSATGICEAMKRLPITRKKNT